jgi:hypothetical protein
MAGTIPLSMTQQLDQFGQPLAGGHLYLIQAGTTSTPQNGFQDSALTLPLPNPIILDASGRIPQFFLADGSIKVRLTDVNGVEKLVADGLIVTGASSGGGGGSPVDPTTVLQTGWLQPIYGTGVVAGFVRCNGRTIGSSTSGATERANADTLALFTFLWNCGDLTLAVSTGRGVSAAADWGANKTIALPDFRGRAIAGLDGMGNSLSGRLTSTYSTGTPDLLGSAAGAESQTLTLAQTPTGITCAGTVTVNPNGNAGIFVPVNSTFWTFAAFPSSSGVIIVPSSGSGATIVGTNVFSGANTLTSNNTSGNPHPIMQPTLLMTFYVKL